MPFPRIGLVPPSEPVVTGRTANNGDFVASGSPETYAYNPDGSIKSIATVYNGVTYVETFLYTAGQLTGSTGLVVQV